MNTAIRTSLAILSLTSLTSVAAYGKEKAQPQPLPAVSAAPATFAANPESIRVQLLQNNLGLYQNALAVKNAETSVTAARNALFPQVSLGATLAAGPTFGLSELSFLLPFLMPSNYFSLSEQKDNFQADLLGYKVLELNTYSSALVTYYTALAATKAVQAYAAQAAELYRLYDYKVTQQNTYHNVPLEEIATLRGNYQAANVNAENTQIQVNILRAELAQALGFTKDTTVTLDDTDANPSSYESEPVNSVIDQAIKIAPEMQQYNFAIEAAQAGVGVAEYSWIGGATASGVQGSTSNFSATGQVNLSFGIFPTIEISKRNVEIAQTQLTSLIQSETELVAANLPNVNLGVQVVANAKDEETATAYAFETYEEQYETGLPMATVTNVITAFNAYTTAAYSRVQAEMNLNLARVTLHRVLLDDEFGKIQGCKAEQVAAKKDGSLGGILGGLFGGGAKKQKEQDINAICREGGSNQ